MQLNLVTWFLCGLCSANVMTEMIIYDFQAGDRLDSWWVVDDGVMGGRSQGGLEINAAGHAVFSGYVSLENNGGFSSVRYRGASFDPAGAESVVIRLKGDGKRYQFRVKSNVYDRHSYIGYFQTTGEWQEVVLPLSELYPTFRGRRLRMPNYPQQRLEEVAFLIANKKAETFRLEIDYIRLK